MDSNMGVLLDAKAGAHVELYTNRRRESRKRGLNQLEPCLSKPDLLPVYGEGGLFVIVQLDPSDLEVLVEMLLGDS